MLVEATVLSGDERLLDEDGHALEVDVDTPYQLEASHDAIVAVENPSALIGLERLDVARSRAAVEAARRQPDVGEVNR